MAIFVHNTMRIYDIENVDITTTNDNKIDNKLNEYAIPDMKVLENKRSVNLQASMNDEESYLCEISNITATTPYLNGTLVRI